jgi:hypothetical protein
MSVTNPGNLFRTADILSTDKDDSTNTITAQLGDASSQSVDSNGAEIWQQCGFASRPSNVTEGADPAAQALYLTRSDQDMILATRDTRSHHVYSELSPGETCIYATGETGTGQAAIFLKKGGAVTIFTTDDNTSTGAGITFTIGPTGMYFNSPFGTLEFSINGFFVRHHGGSSLELGSIGGMPPPLDMLSSYAVLKAHTVKLPGNAVLLGDSVTGVFNQAVHTLVPIPAPLVPIVTTPCVPLLPVVTTTSASPNVFIAAV